jgi:hypothetical protein
MSEHDNSPIPEAPDAPDTNDAAAVSDAPAPVVPSKPRWRDRAFRFRAVAAVAVAAVIIGAAGGAVTTALVTHGPDHDEHHRIGQFGRPEMPAVPPGGRQGIPGGVPGGGWGDDTDGDLPDPPTSDGTDDGSNQESLAQS